MADLKLKLGQEVDINKVDSTIVVAGSGGGKLGELVFSKGSVEWWPAGKSVNCVTFTWEQLAKVLKDNGTPKKFPKTKATVKSAVKPAAKSAAKPTAVAKSKSDKPDRKK